MIRALKILLVVMLVAVLVAGLATITCCDTNDNPNANGVSNGNSNGNVSNGNEPNGEEPNGDEPVEPAEPDLISGLGTIIDCDEYSGQGFAAGDPAPDFRFEDALGQTFSLSDSQGKMVMLNFWATWCGYCVKELPDIQQIYEEWPSDELVLIAIDVVESPEKVSAYIAERGISLPVLLDVEGKVMAQYRVSGIPRTFFIDKHGDIQFIVVGAFPGVEEIEDILEQLAAIGG